MRKPSVLIDFDYQSRIYSAHFQFILASVVIFFNSIFLSAYQYIFEFYGFPKETKLQSQHKSELSLEDQLFKDRAEGLHLMVRFSQGFCSFILAFIACLMYFVYMGSRARVAEAQVALRRLKNLPKQTFS